MGEIVRDAGERKTDTIARLEAEADAWVATANAGQPHLVPLSLAWDGIRVILATPASSPTARNAAASGDVRLALGTSRDVTIIEATAAVVPCADAPESVVQCYATRTGWDPRHEDVPHVYLIATPRTMRAWKTLAEINGRTIMRDGRWTSG
ncbi:MAG: pyridoxamine 5'-phosphate oxidase family protein [Streptosporangiaceae bacterium]